MTKALGRAIGGHVFIIAFLTASFAVFMITVLQNLTLAERSVKQSLGVYVYMQAGVSDEEAQKWADSLSSQDPEVLSASFITKDHAYQEALKDPSLSKALMVLKTNPLPSSVELRFSDRAWWERAEPAQALKASPFIQEIRWDPEAQVLFRSLRRWRLCCIRFSLYVGTALALWAFMGAYRFLYFQLTARELFAHLGLGLAAGFAALTLGWFGLQSALEGATLWWGLLPLLIASGAAVGFFGVEWRRAD